MERPSGAELRIRRQANKTFVLRTHTGKPARGSPLPHNKTSRKVRKVLKNRREAFN